MSKTTSIILIIILLILISCSGRSNKKEQAQNETVKTSDSITDLSKKWIGKNLHTSIVDLWETGSGKVIVIAAGNIQNSDDEITIYLFDNEGNALAKRNIKFKDIWTFYFTVQPDKENPEIYYLTYLEYDNNFKKDYDEVLDINSIRKISFNVYLSIRRTIRFRIL